MTDTQSRNRESTEERLLSAAMSVFARKGFAGASVAEIANEASANVSLINRYFGGKDGLLLSLIKRVITEKQTGRLTYTASDTVSREVLNYLLFRYAEDKKLGDFLRLCVSEMAINDALRSKALVSLQYGADENFRERLSKLQHSGKIKAEADLTELFRIVSLLSFSASFVERELLAIDAAKTEALFETASRMIEYEFGAT